MTNYSVKPQKLFSPDEMLKLAESKNIESLEKYILPFGYKKMRPPPVPATVKELYIYGDEKNPATGTYNTVSWVAFNGKSGLHRYVSFSFFNQDHYNQAVTFLKKRGFGVVKNAVKDLGNGFKSYAQFVRNDKTGIQLSISDALIYPATKIAACEIAITAISTPNWPDDEK